MIKVLVDGREMVVDLDKNLVMSADGKPIPADSPLVAKAKQAAQKTQQTAEKFTLCRVSILKSGENRYFLCDIEGVVIGNMVVIPVNDSEEKGVVLSVEHHTRITAPCNPDELQHIIRVEK